MREEGVDFQQCSDAFLRCGRPERLLSSVLKPATSRSVTVIKASSALREGAEAAITPVNNETITAIAD
jgi:hypothetical protein